MDNDINFTYDLNTEVYGSCAATLDGEMFVLGGWNEERQVNTKKGQKSEQSDGLMISRLYIINFFRLAKYKIAN